MDTDLDPRIARGMERQLAARRAALDAGSRPVGWKVGFGSQTAMAQLGITAPLVGWLTDASLMESGSTQTIRGWSQPMFEPEVAVHLSSDVPAGAELQAVAAAVGGYGPAIELVDLDPPPGDIEEICADNIYHRAVVLGEARPGASLDGVAGRVVVDGEEAAATSDPQALPGDAIALAKHVADLLGGFGESLRAGEVIIMGAIVPPIEIRSGARFLYELMPLGSLDLSFS